MRKNLLKTVKLPVSGQFIFVLRGFQACSAILVLTILIRKFRFKGAVTNIKVIQPVPQIVFNFLRIK
jgi:hypothetical protein